MLHFITLIPPNPFRERIQKLRLHIKKEYKSSHALNAPPHITLLSPFDLKSENREKASQLVKTFSKAFNPLKISLKGLSTFGNRVVFIDVMQDKSLMELQIQLEKLARSHKEIFSYNYHTRPYHPHMTLAFKDLTPANFNRLWRDLKNYSIEENFTADSLILLQHQGNKRGWIVEEEFSLGNK